ncbi:MAG: 50S ribosomal protein L30 [Gammaproteobacteria bacterium]|nr:50S ribosomal protein L30 [Gammaproteobacteria bacterium]
MNQLKVTLIKSLIGRIPSHRQCARGLGLRRIRHSVVVAATPENVGMINQIRYLVSVEAVSS